MSDLDLLYAALSDARREALSLIRESLVRCLEERIEDSRGSSLFRTASAYSKAVWIPAAENQLLA